MERKKKKLDSDCHPFSTLDFRNEDFEDLFNKKFTYCKHDSWTLEDTPLSQHEFTTCQTSPSKPHHACEVSKQCTPDVSKGSSVSTYEEFVGQRQREGQSNFNGAGLPEDSDAGDKYSAFSVSDGVPAGNQATSPTKTSSGPFYHAAQDACPACLHNGCMSSGDNAHRQSEFVLPKPWQCDVLMALKEELNALKDQLSDKEMVAWHQHTSATNPAGKVVSEMKRRFHTELCTQAWCKFHEILATCHVLPQSLWGQTPSDLQSVHLCEAPGAFITSLNHFLASRGYKGKWSWLGTTLNPYYEGNDTGQMIDDDRFIRTTYKNWFFGKDNSGDLMSMENLEHLLDRMKATDVHLVTADGSIDCQENPAEQEILVSRLHHSEVLTACLLLAPGGTLVIKLFTMFEASSITLLYFLNCTFTEVTVCKPATSKSGNSEVYVVCTGYTAPLPQGLLLAVFSAVVSSDQPDIVLLDRQAIPDSFLAEHIKCCRYFGDLQSQTISGNIALYQKVGEEEQKQLSHRQDLCVDHYVRVCGIQQIVSQSRIVPFGSKSSYSRFSAVRSKFSKPFTQRNVMENFNSKSMDSSGGTWMLPPGRFQGTFRERQQQHSLVWSQLLARIPDYQVEDIGCQTIQCRQCLREEEYGEWKPLMGRPLQSVASSQFCDARLLAGLKQLFQHSQLQHHQQQAFSDYAQSVLTDATNLLTGNHFCSHHLNTPALSETFHVALEGSVTSVCQRELAVNAPRGLRPLDSLSKLGDRHTPVGVVIDVTWPQWVEMEEVRCQRRLLDVVLSVCSYLPEGSSIVILAPLCLTRLSAGLIYILAGLFRQTSISSRSSSMFLHQLYYFQYLQVPLYSLLGWLEGLRHTVKASHNPTHLLQGSQRMSVGGEESGPETEASDQTATDTGGGEVNDCCKPVNSTGESEGTDAACLGKHTLKGAMQVSVEGEGGSTVCAKDHTHVCTCQRTCSTSSDKRMSVGSDERESSELLEPGNCSVQDVHDKHGQSHLSVCSACGVAVVMTDHCSPNVRGTTTLADSSDEKSRPDRCSCCSEHISSSNNDQTEKVSLEMQAAEDLNIPPKANGSSTTTVICKCGNKVSSTLLTKDSRRRSEENGGRRFTRGSEADCGDNASANCPRSSSNGRSLRRRVSNKVPLEVVPILQILNDTTFTRFLQSCNKNCVGSFVNTVKAAEQALLLAGNVE